MLELSEMAKRILSELEEAHAENVASTINTIIDPTGDSSEVELARSALESLVEGNLVRIGYIDVRGKLSACSKAASLADLANLSQRLIFKPEEGYWTWNEQWPIAKIIATKPGLVAARQLLTQYGYQWWRSE